MDAFSANIGAEAIRDMLAAIDLESTAEQLREDLRGLWADDFQKLQVVPMLVITPLTFLGGEADGMRMDVSGLRVPNPGERGVYFLESTMNQQASPIIGWNQGQFLIQQSGSQAQIYTASGRPVVGFQRVEANVQALNENEASGLQMHSGPAMSVTNFKAHVREVVRSSEERVEAAQ